MSSFWRYVQFKVDDPATGRGHRGWIAPWSADDLARRHWYLDVQQSIEPLDLSPADWQWLRGLERPWWELVRRQRRTRPNINFIYDDLFAGPAGARLRRRALDRPLLRRLRALAEAAGVYHGAGRYKFWQAVLSDFKKASATDIKWTTVSRLLGRRVNLRSSTTEAEWADLPPIWRETVAAASEQAAAGAVVRRALAHWSEPAKWSQYDRQVVVSGRKLHTWLDGWSALADTLRGARSGSVVERRQQAWRVTREFYWHELTRGLSEAELMLLGVTDSQDRAAIRARLAALRHSAEQPLTGLLQRDMNLLTGRHLPVQDSWHRQAVGRQWRQLSERVLTVPQLAELAEAWGQSLLGDDWSGWSVVVREGANSWSVEPAERVVTVPDRPATWTVAEALPIIAHELTHVWQTEQGSRQATRSLAIWHHAATSTQPLAEAGAMRTERAVRHFLGGPDQSRQYYLLGLRARRRGASFSQVLAAVARGLARQQGWTLARVPVERRADLIRQAFRRTLRLYRPTLTLNSSRRLLNEEQLKYVESALLAEELQRAGLASLLSINTIDLNRWPLYRRLGYDPNKVEPFPLVELLAIINQTIKQF